MPIDLRQFVKNQQQRDLYRKSLALRCDDDDARRFVEALAAQEAVTSLLKERDAYKFQVRKGLITEKSTLKKLEDRLTVSQTTVQELLWRLPNWVDFDILQEYADSPPNEYHVTRYKCGDNEQSKFSQDPLFCAQCFEELGNTAALVGSGIQFASATNQYIVNSLQTFLGDLSKDVSHWNLPSSLELLTTHQYHDLWGCCGTSKCKACPSHVAESTKPQLLSVPSWFTLLRNQNGTYWDRQLPKTSLLFCTTLNNDDQVDKREVATRLGKKEPWYQRLAVQEKIQFLVVTGPSLHADSRPLQRRIIKCLLDLFQQLLENEAPTTIRVRAIHPAALMPMESSRLIVEGYLPPEKPVCLAYLSNLRDYCTGHDLRHGTTKESLHVLQGTICSTAGTMEWIGRNRADPSSFTLPRVLVHAALPERLLYTRKVVVNKKGKRFVKTIAVSFDDGKRNVEGHCDAVGLPVQPTVEQIQAEALSSPFIFLPFHYS